MGYEAFERLVRSDDESNREIVEALVDPGFLNKRCQIRVKL